MEQSVAYGVSQGRVTDVGIPFSDRALASDDGSTRLVAFLYDIEQVAAFPVSQSVEQEVVDDQELYLAQPGDRLKM